MNGGHRKFVDPKVGLFGSFFHIKTYLKQGSFSDNRIIIHILYAKKIFPLQDTGFLALQIHGLELENPEIRTFIAERFHATSAGLVLSQV